MKKLRFLVLPFAILGCVLLLASCKGTGKYYFYGNEKGTVIEITSSKWIETYEGKTREFNIEWLSDNTFKMSSDIFYCDGGLMYNIKHPTSWYSSKPVENK